MIARIREWLQTRLWVDDLHRVPRARALGIGTLRVAIHAGRSFSRNLVGVQAAGLTMFSLLGLVPLLWLGLSVAEGFGFADRLVAYLAELRSSGRLPETLDQALQGLEDAVGRVSLKALGLLGCIVLGYSGYALFVTVEQAFNHVWRARQRSWYKRLGSFLGLVVLVPVFVLSGIAVESVLKEGSLVVYMREHAPRLEAMYDAGVRFLPAVFVWISLTLLYKLMPSAKVHWRVAAVSGAVASTALVLLLGFYVRMQVGLALNNKVYFALATLPMLIVYLSLMWAIVLAGVQVAYAMQHVNELGPPAEEPEVDTGSHMRLALALAHAAADGGGADLSAFTEATAMPPAWVDRVAEDLVAGGILRFDGAGHHGAGEDRVCLERPAEQITVWDVVQAVTGHDGERELQLPASVEARLGESLRAMEASLSGLSLALHPVARDGQQAAEQAEQQAAEQAAPQD